MPSSPKKTQNLFAEKARLQRQEKRLQHDVETWMKSYLHKHDITQYEDITSWYNEADKKINNQFTTKKKLKAAYDFFRSYILELNETKNLSLPLPASVVIFQRDKPIIEMDWNHKGHETLDVVQRLFQYWEITENSHAFSDEEIIGNILLSSILFAGVNDKADLEALLEHLKRSVSVQKIADLNIIFLNAVSRNYGNIFVDEHSVMKSRNFIPDHITRLWLIHFNSRKITKIYQSLDYYIHLIYQKLNLKFQKNTLSHLIKHARYHWGQLPHVNIDPAMSECLLGHLQTCGLPEEEFEKFISPTFKEVDETETKVTKRGHDFPTQDFIINHTLEVDDVLKIHKNLLKIIRTPHTDSPIHTKIINYAIEDSDQFSEYSRRIVLWLISLFSLIEEDIQELAKVFNFCPKQFIKISNNSSPLEKSSIYTYYTRIAEPWFIYSLQYQFSEEDEESHLNKVYEKIYQNNCLIIESDQQKIKKSAAQIIKMLKRFHHFQQILFNAPPFSLNILDIQTRPNARIIGTKTYQLFMKKLEQSYQQKIITQHDYENLCLIYILAYRTGMRINEILGLRVKDLEGLKKISLLVKPYGSERKGNRHNLKTDSSQRSVPAFCLLKTNEHELLLKHVVHQRNTKKLSDYLFSAWNSHKKLSQHTVTFPFKTIMQQLLQEHQYTFHSFRHSAANHLALLFKCDFEFLKQQQLTDFSALEYEYIRSQLWRHNIDQNHWIILSHILGHLEPDETFKTYIHVMHLIAGYELSKYQPQMTNHLVKKIIGFNEDIPEFNFLRDLNDDVHFKFQIHALTLSNLIVAPHIQWQSSNFKKVQLRSHSSQIKPHCYLDYFAGTPESKIEFDLFYKSLILLENYDQNVNRVCEELCINETVVQYWLDNAIKLKQLTTRKNNPRLFINANIPDLKPHLVETKEDLMTVKYFFSRLTACYKKAPKHIDYVLNYFMHHVTASHTGLHATQKNIQELELFYQYAQELFPQNLWHLLSVDCVNSLDQQNTPNLLKLAKENLKVENYPKSREKNMRLQLYSLKSKKALPAFKFCLHLACIGRPKRSH